MNFQLLKLKNAMMCLDIVITSMIYSSNPGQNPSEIFDDIIYRMISKLFQWF